MSLLLKEFVVWLLYGVHIFFNVEKMLWFRMLLSNLELWLIFIFIVSLCTSLIFGIQITKLLESSKPKPKSKPPSLIFTPLVQSFFSLTVFFGVVIASIESESPEQTQNLESGILWLDILSANYFSILIALFCICLFTTIVLTIWKILRHVKISVRLSW